MIVNELGNKNKKSERKMKKYNIEYTLSNGLWCQNVFEGKNKEEALKNYNRLTGVSKSKVVSVERVDNI